MIRTTLVISALPILFVGCGGSGGSGGNSDVAASNTVSFTEDTSLSENLTGIWIVTSEVETSENSGDYTRTFKGKGRDTLYIIEGGRAIPGLSFGGFFIGDCKAPALNTEYDSSNLVFNLNGIDYALQKQSNTRMSGTAQYNSEYSETEGGGTITLIKVKSGPQSIDEFIDISRGTEFGALGILTFSYNNRPNQTMVVNCYSDGSGTETYTSGSRSESSKIDGVTLANISVERVDITIAKGDDTDYLTIETDEVYGNFASDYKPGHVTYQAHGKNNLTIKFDASMTRDTDDATSDAATIEGSADLEF